MKLTAVSSPVSETEGCIDQPGYLVPYEGHVNRATNLRLPQDYDALQMSYCFVIKNFWSKTQIRACQINPPLRFEQPSSIEPAEEPYNRLYGIEEFNNQHKCGELKIFILFFSHMDFLL